MTKTFWKRLSGPILLAGLCAPALANCGGLPGLPGVPGAGNCPDMAHVESLASFDFAKEFQLDAKAAGDLKITAEAVARLNALKAEIDGKLTGACNKLAKDLGGPGDGKDMTGACQATLKIMGDVKAKIGASAKFSITGFEPKCGASIDAMADCAGSCDVTVKGGSAEVKCEGGELSGGCDGSCSGSCEAEGGVQCTGQCDGSCDAQISGTCDGTCDGKCDGKATTAGASGQANCAGKCDGTCKGNAHATCSGKCGGSCKLSGSAKCSGTCSGKCDVKMKAPKCSGKIVPPSMSADCKAKCNAKVNAKVECSPPHPRLVITGAADVQAADKFSAAISANIGPILEVAVALAGRVEDMAADFKVVGEGGVSVAGKLGSPMVKAKFAACFLEPFKGVLDVMGSVKASVKVSVDVKASASASGSASGKTGE